jgi:hypothetical protein
MEEPAAQSEKSSKSYIVYIVTISLVLVILGLLLTYGQDYSWTDPAVEYFVQRGASK